MSAISDISKPVISQEYNVRYVLLICSIAALGGLLFGYDTAVISGAIGPIKQYFQLDSFGVGWAVSNVAIGCIIGALASGRIGAKYGRKRSLIFAAILFTVSAVGSALADTFFWFIVFRMIGGLAVGLASSISPMYISEVSPKIVRGRALSMQNFAIVGGQVVIFVVNYLIAKGMAETWLVDTGWRVMLGSEVIPCVLFLVASLIIPESPRWLVMKGEMAKAEKILARIFNPEKAKEKLVTIQESIVDESVSKQVASKQTVVREKHFWFFVFIASAIAIFQQASGVNVMMYFAPVVLEKVTGNAEISLFLTIWVGVIQLIGTSIGSLLMDKVGRTPLLKAGSIGATIGLLLTSYFIYQSSGLVGEEAIQMGYWTLFGMMVFMICFAFSWSLGAWIVVSEIFPNRMRSLGMSFAIGSMWVSNFFIGLLFPIMNDNAWLNEHFNGAFPMWVFASCMAMSYFFIARFLPETKGVSLEKMEEHILGSKA
ncbi:D-xylose-proton symporter [Vibrio natriegens]|uniref:sugar porter family MFS transporter n=1 Tax=Vibrio TaxID=662 RepID=UPI000804447A|nr:MULTISPECIES: sugar porter family MFS transporter [Vibrio]ANQ21888.1 D-xylose-proton symporter [Vibrio natriegens]AXT71096.1 MFS transporter [Vibrio sp. dhg]MEE3880071.1 sugar porter family MFS transporter [Vibrio sp. YYF0003]